MPDLIYIYIFVGKFLNEPELICFAPLNRFTDSYLNMNNSKYYYLFAHSLMFSSIAITNNSRNIYTQ